MFLSTAVGGTAALLTAGGFLLRRRISRGWITRSSIAMQHLTKDQTIIITGGNVGLGFETAKDLAGCGGKVILACRNVDAGKEAAAKIQQSTGNEDVECMKLDLSQLESVQQFASAFKERNENLYALICNAGVWVPDGGQKTKDGFEIHFGVNHLGHFALIQALLPQMKQSGLDGRIIIVSSSLCKSGQIDLLQKRDFIYDGRALAEGEKKSFAPLGYCDSKLMNMLTCRELANRLPSNITTYAVSPGFCKSSLGRNVNVPIYKKAVMVPMMRLFQRSSTQGALNIFFTVTEDKEKLQSGAMYQDGKIWEGGAELVDRLGDDVQKGLWELSEELVKEKLQN
ncbi:hypothetical protein ACHAXT_009399 [Thalassiosira profunda]